MMTRASSPNQPQERCKMVHVAMHVGQNMRLRIVTTTMELDETKGACQLSSWQVAHVRFISDNWLRTTNDGLNGVCGGECWPNPNDTLTPTSTDHNGRPSPESRAHAQGG